MITGGALQLEERSAAEACRWARTEGSPLPLGATWIEREQAFNFAACYPCPSNWREGTPRAWQRIVDTAPGSPDDFADSGAIVDEPTRKLAPRSIVVLLRNKGRWRQ